MKKSILILALTVFAASSCSKKDDTPQNQTPGSYMSLNANEARTYQNTDNSTGTPVVTEYTITSTNRDSSVSSRNYHVFINSATQGSEYYAVSGNDYYNLRALPTELGGSLAEVLYLKTNVAVGSGWDQNFNINFSGVPITATLNNTVVGTELSRTVLGKAYSHVIQIKTTVSASAIPSNSLTSNIQSYYAPGYGLIESSSLIDLDYLGITSHTDMVTLLKSSNF
ncbi:MAG: hypothetical protein IPL97_00655 [Niastella sp.]|nr:hypothetical protein [Niastella sp.]